MAQPIKTVANLVVQSSPTIIFQEIEVKGLSTGGFVVGFQMDLSPTDHDPRFVTLNSAGVVTGTLARPTGVNGDRLEESPDFAESGPFAFNHVFADDSAANGFDIVLQVGSANTTGRVVPVSEDPGDQIKPEIVQLSNGVYAIAYYNIATGNVEARIYDPAFGNIGIARIVGAYGFAGADIGLTSLSGGGFAVSYSDAGGGAVRIYSANGFPVTATIPTGAIFIPSIEQLADGRIVVFQPGTGILTFLNENGSGLTSVNLGQSSVAFGAVTALHDGRMMAVWLVNGSQSLAGAVIRPDGSIDGGVFTVAAGVTSTTGHTLDTLADGRVAVSWVDTANDVLIAVYDPRETGVTVIGTAANDSYVGTAFSDGLFGGAGNDTLAGWGGDDTIYGMDGIDLIGGGDGADRLIGGSGDDGMYGEGGDDIMSGEFGNDFMSGGAGTDAIYGGGGNDTITGEDALDGLHGEDGDDTIYGGAGGDYIYGGAGNDTLSGEADADFINGNDGNDIISGGGGADVISGDAGSDSITGEAGTDALYGGSGNDVIDGGQDADSIFGEAGTDNLYGGTGNDMINGGTDRDFIFSGAGNDQLYGGTGSDIFDFRGDINAGQFDTIVDFEDNPSGVNDFIVLQSSLQGSTVIYSPVAGITQIFVPLGGGTSYVINVANTSVSGIQDNIIWA